MSGPVPGEGEDGGVQAGQGVIGAGGAVAAAPAAGVRGDVGPDEAEDGGERDEAGVEPGGSGGPGGRGGGDVVDEQQGPGFLAGQVRGLAAQRAAGPADGPLQMKERDFDLPSLGIQDGDVPGRVGLVVQQGGQHPHHGGLGPAAAGHRGDGEGDEPGGGFDPECSSGYDRAYEQPSHDLCCVAGEYVPQAGGGVTAGMQAVKYATDFSWSQTPATNLSIAGAQTVNLPACPTGVTGTEPWYYVYISGTGTPEAVLVTGGTCTGNGQAGTLQFTTLNAHPAGYTIASASSGLQEALIAARFVASNPSGPSQSGKVIVPPGELQAYARISVRASNVTVDFSGSIVNCYMQDSCIFAGDPSNSTAFLDITLVNPRGRPMSVSGQSPFIEVNAQKTRLVNVTTRIPPTGGTFSSYVQVDNDQSFLLDGLDMSLATGSSDYGVLCNASVCNPVIYAPGPFSSNAAVGWLKNLNISLQCAGNGIDWQSGNTVKISDSVIEGFAQYGVRAGTKRGGYGGFELDNVYEEVGSCSNPAGAIGEAGVIAQGATVKVQGSMLPVGFVPQFANTGSTDYRYYIVANSTTFGASNPLYAGRALTNGSGNITVTTPDVAGANTFDLLRVT